MEMYTSTAGWLPSLCWSDFPLRNINIPSRSFRTQTNLFSSILYPRFDEGDLQQDDCQKSEDHRHLGSSIGLVVGDNLQFS